MSLQHRIEYSGLADRLPTHPTCFKQLVVSETLTLEVPATHIMLVHAAVDIVSTRMVRSPVGASYEGQLLTGAKLCLIGIVKLRLTGLATTGHALAHTHAALPFSTFIVVPVPTERCGEGVVVPYIEDVQLIPCDRRHAVVSVAIFLNLH